MLKGPMVDKECPRCGSALKDGECAACGGEVSFRAAHRDIILLFFLCAIAVAVFMFTRFVAALDKHASDRLGEIWFSQGEQELTARQYEAAIESFRKARARDRDKREYVLALASALESANHTDEARQALLHIREVAPESAEVNLPLARLAAQRQDVTEALRYYHNALYGLWNGSQVDEQRREVRIELANFLLAHKQLSMALSELLVLDTELPDDARAYVDIGEMFLRAGDPAHALKDFTHALHLKRNDADALAGAGQAAFDTQDYVQSRKYLQAAKALGSHRQAVEDLVSVIAMVFARDPLLPRLPQEERIRRATDDYQQSLNTLQTCMAAQQNQQEPLFTRLQLLHAETLAFRERLQPKNLRGDPEAVRDAVELVYRIEHAVDTTCAPVQQVDRALLLIGRKHIGGLQ
jgi:tetratricopeptide (TPR) repeat protein